VGGTTAGEGNVISGNGIGIRVGRENVIQGNLIGTDISGLVAVPNQTGLTCEPSLSFTAQVWGNVISGNTGVGIDGLRGSFIGNLIGTDATGRAALGNGIGVRGGGDVGPGNVISGNTGYGVIVTSSMNLRGNLIGIAADGVSALGNGAAGVRALASAFIGWPSADGPNAIAHNGGAGLEVVGATEVFILVNTIAQNAGLGIDLGADGPTLNDAGDGDEGANHLQNYPELLGAAPDGQGGLVVSYRVPSDALATAFPLQVDFYAADASGSGQVYLASDTYTLDDFLAGPQSVTVDPARILNGRVVAVAADASQNSSEFTATPLVTPTAPAPAEVALVVGPLAPNPAVDAAVLTVSLPAAERVGVGVYDALGRRVLEVLAALLERGTAHRIALDVGALPAGAYFVRVRGESFVRVLRLTVAR
ncbi:MAG TPA: T9SS type A sorting domain-containing protein, partial [Rhodothermales bacterium]|nr:T9SS type A sorting domain-containing protein [Rhodothermales bacterium]